MSAGRRRGRGRALLVAVGLVGFALGAVLTALGRGTGADADRAGSPTVPGTPAVSGTPAVPATPATTAPVTSVPPTPAPSTAPASEGVLLVWSSGGLPDRIADRVTELNGVAAVSEVAGDEVALHSTADGRGVTVEAWDEPWHVPLDALVVDPARHRPFVTDPADAETLDRLSPGRVVLTDTSAALRGLGPGGHLRIGGADLVVAGVVGDRSGSGAEVLVHPDDAPAAGVTTTRFLLVSHRGHTVVLQDQIATLFDPPRPVRFRTGAETTWWRHGDAVVPPALIKVAYGEFAVADGRGRELSVDPAWRDEVIVTAEVPLLGRVTCHPDTVTALTDAMGALESAGLGHLVDPAAFAGCYAPRRIAAGGAVSRHAWGIAVDLNVGDNPRGSFSTQDRRLVEAMRDAGFGWGGTWLVPDPAHYELRGPS